MSISTNISHPMEFSIAHTARGRKYPGLDYYRVRMGAFWEDQIRRKLMSGSAHLEARLVHYITDGVYDLVIRKSKFNGKQDKAKKTGAKTFMWSGEGREPGNFMSFVLNDEKVIDFEDSELKALGGGTDFAYEPPFRQFPITRLDSNPVIASFTPNGHSAKFWNDGYSGPVIYMTFDLPAELKDLKPRSRRTAEERKRDEANANDATRRISVLESDPRPTTNAKQLVLDLPPTAQTVSDKQVVPMVAAATASSVREQLNTDLEATWKSLKELMSKAARHDIIVTVEGSGEDASMKIERIQRFQTVYR